ncbi:MAG: DUF3891 family protein [Opitutaceae bacterium]|nr:DUF3891 family protein [Opitutaceae bacterium]
MIRAETETGWILIKHTDHAMLAGEFARCWAFPKPEPFDRVLYAVAHHDDGWTKRDTDLSLTAEGKPEAFTRTLVGAYSAFEEIDLPSYLRVRGEATRIAAETDPLAGILISMHTVNLLTEQADLASIRPEHRPLHAEFVAGQQAWQRTTAQAHGFTMEQLQRGFEFLQACDNLSLIACSGFDRVAKLRHTHPDRSGQRVTLTCTHKGPGHWGVDPWPFEAPRHEFTLPYRQVFGARFSTLADYRAAYAAGAGKTAVITLSAA